MHSDSQDLLNLTEIAFEVPNGKYCLNMNGDYCSHCRHFKDVPYCTLFTKIVSGFEEEIKILPTELKEEIFLDFKHPVKCERCSL